MTCWSDRPSEFYFLAEQHELPGVSLQTIRLTGRLALMPYKGANRTLTGSG